MAIKLQNCGHYANYNGHFCRVICVTTVVNLQKKYTAYLVLTVAVTIDFTYISLKQHRMVFFIKQEKDETFELGKEHFCFLR